MTAQQGKAQLSWQSHYDPFHPGMIASQYPHSIKSAIFMESATSATLKFGTACGRHGGDTKRPHSADNFTGSSYTNTPRYAAGGGAYVTDTIGYDVLPAGTLHADAVAGATSLVVAHGGASHEIVPGDLLQITNTATPAVQLEIVRVTAIASNANGISVTVLRGQYGSTGSALTAGDKVNIYGRTNNFAGVALKDITLEGRWIEGETDSFVNLDEVPVGIKGDFAVLLDVATTDTGLNRIRIDDPVSVNISNTGTHTATNIYRPYATTNVGFFSNAGYNSQTNITIKGARYVTGPYTAKLWTRGTRGPGSGHEETVAIAAVRFAGNV